jgi:alpha-1,3-rhamnosyl/mannosyltransferase
LFEHLHFGYPRRLSVFHGPDARLPRYRDVPLVASVHDTFSADTDAFADAGFRAKKRERYLDLARRADVVITFSEYTRGRYVHHTGADPERVRVIPHGVDARFGIVDPVRIEEVRGRHALGDRYLLYVGQLSSRKNLVRVLEAYSRIDPGVRLVCAGPRSRGHETIDAAHRRLELSDRVQFLGPVPDETLPALYAGALAHVLLSLDEGFGLPVLEAFSAGTPVLASNRGAIPEVAGDAAVLVDPTDVDAMSQAMQQLVEDAAHRDDLRRRGKARAAEFTWRRAARATLDVYREVSGG